jgi:hypothetical protein
MRYKRNFEDIFGLFPALLCSPSLYSIILTHALLPALGGIWVQVLSQSSSTSTTVGSENIIGWPATTKTVNALSGNPGS